MTHDVEVLQRWLQIAVVIAAIGATSVPFTYSFFPWRTRPTGRVLMFKAIAFAAAMDVTVLFSFWTPNDILVVFWINIIILAGIATSTMSFSILMLWLGKNHHERQQK